MTAWESWCRSHTKVGGTFFWGFFYGGPERSNALQMQSFTCFGFCHFLSASLTLMSPSKTLPLFFWWDLFYSTSFVFCVLQHFYMCWCVWPIRATILPCFVHMFILCYRSMTWASSTEGLITVLKSSALMFFLLHRAAQTTAYKCKPMQKPIHAFNSKPLVYM